MSHCFNPPTAGSSICIRRSDSSTTLPTLVIDPSSNAEYRKKRDNIFKIFDVMSEDEQVFLVYLVELSVFAGNPY
jgi:hypothetical protein